MTSESVSNRFRRSLREFRMGEALSEPLLQSLYSDDPIEKILSKKDVTTTTLQNLIRLLLVPTQLLPLEGSHIIPALMDLLRRHCKHNRPYDSEYGFYCVEAILFTLGIGILAESKFLKQYIDQTANLPTPRNTRGDYVTLGDCVAQFLPKDQHTGVARVFHTPTQTLAPSLGGFTTEDLCYLVNVLFQDRKQMFRAHTIAETSPGWWYTVYLMLLFNEYTLRDHGLGDKIYDIALRVELNSTWDKHDLLDKVILMTGTNPQQFECTQASATAMDPEDASLVLGGYYQYITKHDKRNTEVLGLIILWAGDITCGRNDLDMHLEYLISHLDVLWEGVVRGDDTLGRMAEGTTYPASFILLAEHFLKFTRYMIAKQSQDGQYRCVEMLLKEGDLINLTGRIILWFTRFDVSLDEILEIATQQAKLNAALVELASSIKLIHERTHRPVPYTFEAIMDWLKVAYYLEDAVKLCSPNSHARYHYMLTATAAWSDVRSMIPVMLTEWRCRNPVCNQENPQFMCARCRFAPYCSRECQARDWEYRSTRPPHWLQCGTQGEI
ncbi:hypothetical protein FRC12_009865 [Ceratobasidium sp. 428]|nr:hypothetical protein FRC12_009865 [Ceratobasidium sp. 428]